jgi:hypothetical protein
MTYNKKKNKDAQKPLMEYAFSEEAKRIDAVLSQLPFKLKQLGNDLDIIGSDNDNMDYRKELNDKLNKMQDGIKEVKSKIDDF